MANIEPNKVIKWNDKELVMHDFSLSHANGGRLEKFWMEDIKTGRQFLIKGCSLLSYEPFCEKIAYIIGKDLGMDVLEYDIIPAKEFKGMVKLNPFCKYVSICERIDRKNFSITSVAEIKRAKNAVRDESVPTITNKEVMYEIMSKKYLDTLLIFDAIIGNVDRHYGNVHLLRGIDGEMIEAPILDNGASLLANKLTIPIYLLGDRVGELYNRSSTIDKTHDRQLRTINALRNINYNIPSKTVQIINDIQPVLDLMPKMRAVAIKKYIVYRLHKYLGMLKHDPNFGSLKLNNIKNESIMIEKEHT